MNIFGILIDLPGPGGGDGFGFLDVIFAPFKASHHFRVYFFFPSYHFHLSTTLSIQNPSPPPFFFLSVIPTAMTTPTTSDPWSNSKHKTSEEKPTNPRSGAGSKHFPRGTSSAPLRCYASPGREQRLDPSRRLAQDALDQETRTCAGDASDKMHDVRSGL